MILSVKVEMNLKTKEAIETVQKAARLAMRDTVVDVANTVINVHPWKNRTGNNSRSIKYESSGYETGEGVVDQSKIEGAVYSTSGYGGYLETGHHTRSGSRVDPMPYFKPAFDRHGPKFPEKMKEYLP